MTTLGFERGTSATTSHRRFQKELDEILKESKKNGSSSDPLVRQRLARAWSKVKIMEINGYRSLTAVLNKSKDPSVAALGATNKMFWSEYHQDVMKLAMDIRGMGGQVLSGGDEEEFIPGYGRRPANRAYPADAMQSAFFFSRSETIWGGAAEIQRNIVGERVLGLPKEPKVAGE
jgi:hypothetical protein